jgi:MFS family permease
VSLFYAVVSSHSCTLTFHIHTHIYIHIETAIIAVPTFGILIDKKGRALYFICVASVMTMVTQIMFLLLNLNIINISPVAIMIWQGLSYSLGAASIWPILSFIIDPKLLATGYGCMTAIQNTGQAIAPLVVSLFTTYTADIIFFQSVSLTTLIFTLILIYVDYRNGGRLNATSSERTALISTSLLDDDLLTDEDIATLISPIGIYGNQSTNGNNTIGKHPQHPHLHPSKQILFEDV